MPRRNHGSTRPTHAMPRWPHRVSSQRMRWRRSPNPRNRLSMIRIILFLLLIAFAAAGAAWIADQPGNVVMTWGGWRASPSVPVFVMLLGIVVVVAVALWSLLRMLWRTPGHVSRRRREHRLARGRHAITQGLIAIGHGDASSARGACRNRAPPRRPGSAGAVAARTVGAARWRPRRCAARLPRHGRTSDTRLLGLRGLFVEAQRADDPVAAMMIARRTLKLAPSSTWASQAVLGFRCAKSGLERRAGDPRQQSGVGN